MGLTDLHDSPCGDHLGVTAFQIIRELCAKYNLNEPDTLIAVEGIIEDGISSITRVVELTDELVEVKRTSEVHENKYKTEVSRLTDIAAQHTLMQQKTADILAHASGGVV